MYVYYEKSDARWSRPPSDGYVLLSPFLLFSIVLSVLQLTTSDCPFGICPFGIFKLFLCPYYERLLIIQLCVTCSYLHFRHFA